MKEGRGGGLQEKNQYVPTLLCENATFERKRCGVHGQDTRRHHMMSRTRETGDRRKRTE